MQFITYNKIEYHTANHGWKADKSQIYIRNPPKEPKSNPKGTLKSP